MNRNDLAIGVDLGGTNTRAGLVTREGEIVGRGRGSTRLDLGSNGVIDGIVRCVRDAAEDGGVSLDEVAAVGVGAPGPLDPFEGIIISPENLQCMHGVPLRSRLEEALNCPVRVDNDANMAAMGEQWLGAGRDVGHFLCVTLGTGVGGGWIANGEVMQGFNGNAAEVGHVTIDREGPLCPCGNRGCLELYASATAMVRRTRERLESDDKIETSMSPEGLTTEQIYKAAEGGDVFAAEMFEETGSLLGIGLVSVLNVLNVQVIALGGGLARAGERIFSPVRKALEERGTVGVKEHVSIIPTELGDDAGILGAARLARS